MIFSGAHHAAPRQYTGYYVINNDWFVQLSSGRWIVIADSNDGVHYSKPVVLEEDETRGFCYPAMYFVGDGILLAYCSGGKEDGACLNRTTIRKVYV